MAQFDLRLPKSVIFGWGSQVFACSDEVWQNILELLADPFGYDLEELVQKRCIRLSERKIEHLGLISRDEAKLRLQARKELQKKSQK